MTMLRSLIVTSKNQENVKVQKTITYISGSASSADLLQLGRGLTSLTNHTYEQSDLVLKYNADTEEVPTIAGGE